jgi:hypothetical protein
MMLNEKPDISGFQKFGGEAWLHRRVDQGPDSKFDARGEPVIFVGYAPNQKGFLFVKHFWFELMALTNHAKVCLASGFLHVNVMILPKLDIVLVVFVKLLVVTIFLIRNSELLCCSLWLG